MRIFDKVPNFNFMALTKWAVGLSGLLIIISIVSLFVRGLNFGLDFTGGTLLELRYPQPANLTQIRDALVKDGHEDAVVLHFGTTKEVLIRLAPQKNVTSAEISSEVLGLLKTQEPDVEMRRQEFVGPQVGSELRDDGGLAVLYALIAILIYVIIRFEWRFALGSVAALIHDVIITLGVFSVFQLNFDLTVLAAILAVIGYSLNDTIVVFDRIRENFRKMRKGTSREVVNSSLNQTLSRTLMTSFTTVLVVLAMFFFGGELIHAFSTALTVGIVVGTYSSIYVASAMVLALKIERTHLMPVQKEGAEQSQP
jgi:preprotein translocase subunit SecF